MTEPQPTPALPRIVRLVPPSWPGGTTHSAAPGAVPLVPALPVPPLVPVTRTERTAGAVRRWAGRLWLGPGRPAHRAWHHAPRTMAQHRAWIKGRTWMPPDAEGRAETVIVIAVIAYDHLIARPLKVIGKTMDAAPDHPKRLLSLIAFTAVVVLIFWH